MKIVRQAMMVFAGICLAVGLQAQPRVELLRTEWLENPVGLDTPAPRFTWIISSSQPFEQDAVTVRVASSPELLIKGKTDLWTGEVASKRAAAVYGGTALASYGKYYWNVTVRDTKGRKYTSPVAQFEMAKLSSQDWQAQWINDGFDKELRKPPLLRKQFSVKDKKIRSARAYVCGIGYYKLFINGQRVGDRVLDPGYTQFDKRVLYSTYDVTEMLRSGDNAVAAALGNGWYNIQSMAVWRFEKAAWRDRPKLLCEIRIEYEDGTVQTLLSDTSWRAASGAYIFNSLYSGEVYDARLEEAGWMLAGFDDTKTWKDAIIASAPCDRIEAQCMPPIRVVREINPVSSKDFQGNIRVYDLGENFSGVCRIQLSGERGTKVTMRHGELVFDDGRINTGNIDIYFQREKNNMPLYLDPNEVFQTNTYYLRGDGTEEYTPSFTYHGFRYVEVESDRPVQIVSLTGLFIHTDVQPVGSFECSDETLNWIVKTTRQSYLSNLHSIPTDCPQREKNGWIADGYIALDLALLNFDGITLYEKWLRDFEDNQRPAGNISGIIPSWGWGFDDWIGPVWDASMFIIPATLYKYYGDRRVIEQMWPVCVKYLEYLKTKEKDGMLAYGLGDWVYYKTYTNNIYTSTAFYYLDNVLMARFAEMLGKNSAPYRAKAETFRQLINDKFFDPKTLLYAGGTQAGQAVALALGLVPEGLEQGVADKLVEMIRNNGHNLDFGMLGSKYVPAMLAKYGYAEDAYLMIANPVAPSWAYWKTLGLTALPETWVMDKDFKDASLNHVFLGDVSAWMVNTIAGINIEELPDGTCSMVIKPHFLENLQWAKAEYRSPKGMIRSSWQREGNKIRLKVTIPGNTLAKIYVGSKEVKAGSGNHEFVIAQ